MEVRSIGMVWLLVALLPVTVAVDNPVTKDEETRVRALLKKGVMGLGRRGAPLMGGCVRLGFHDCVGGCDGCVIVDNPSNAGLRRYIEQLETIDRGNMSRADLWALCVIVAIEEGARITPAFDEEKPMPSIKFRAGRPDSPNVCPDRIFPDESLNPIPFLLENFPGLNNSVELAYALMGAHTLGRTHLQASGHEGAWTMFENWCDFEYYRNLVQEDGNLNWKKGELKRPSDNDTIWQWTANKDGHDITMIPVDAHLFLDLQYMPDTIKPTCTFPGGADDLEACGLAADAHIAVQFAQNGTLWMAQFSQAVQAMIDHVPGGGLYDVL